MNTTASPAAEPVDRGGGGDLSLPRRVAQNATAIGDAIQRAFDPLGTGFVPCSTLLNVLAARLGADPDACRRLLDLAPDACRPPMAEVRSPRQSTVTYRRLLTKVKDAVAAAPDTTTTTTPAAPPKAPTPPAPLAASPSATPALSVDTIIQPPPPASSPSRAAVPAAAAAAAAASATDTPVPSPRSAADALIAKYKSQQSPRSASRLQPPRSLVVLVAAWNGPDDYSFKIMGVGADTSLSGTGVCDTDSLDGVVRKLRALHGTEAVPPTAYSGAAKRSGRGSVILCRGTQMRKGDKLGQFWNTEGNSVAEISAASAKKAAQSRKVGRGHRHGHGDDDSSGSSEFSDCNNSNDDDDDSSDSNASGSDSDRDDDGGGGEGGNAAQNMALASVIVHVASAPEEIGPLAANRMQLAVERNAAAFLGMATGSTPKTTRFWHELRQRVAAGTLDLQACTFVNPDEWVGLGSTKHPEAYKSYLKRELSDHFRTNVLVPRGESANPVRAAVRAERKVVRGGGFEWMLLGMGINGHIGFFEPNAEGLPSQAFLPAIAEENRQRYAKDHFGSLDAVPTHATSIGLATCLRAKELCLCVVGNKKAALLAAALHGPVTTSLPASLVQLHGCVRIYVDRAAARYLDLNGLRARPGWWVTESI